MQDKFDRRVVSDDVLSFIHACQSAVPSHLAGGMALSGAWLGHRLSRDVDLFVHEASEHRRLVAELESIASGVGANVQIVRDSGGHVRARLRLAEEELELDVVHEALEDLDAAVKVETVWVESPRDLRASKLTCILSRSEPRDLIDLMFLEKAGHPPEGDLENALLKDAGIDPGVLAWLLKTFPLQPLPQMLVEVGSDDLERYRDDLAERFKRLARE